MTATRRPSTRGGFTAIELLITLVLFTVVVIAALQFFDGQTSRFRSMSEQSSLVQDVRFGRDLLRQELRAAGTNVSEDQPMLVYASASTFAFNADLTTNVEDSVKLTGAVYVDKHAPNAEVSAMLVSSATPIAGSAPSFTYPLANYSRATGTFINSEAETITFWFEPEPGSGDRYTLHRKVNSAAPEVILRGVIRNGTEPFFRYWYDAAIYGGGGGGLDTVPGAWMPLSKSVASRGIIPDTGTSVSARIDRIRAVEVNYSIASTVGGTPRTRLVKYMVPMPNTAHPPMRRSCGRPPIFGRPVAAAWRTTPAPAGIELTWSAAIDQGGGEDDALRYVIWRRVVGTTDLGDPFTTIGVSGTSYTWRDVSTVSGTAYEYAVAVQDCTPNVSGYSMSNPVTAP
jgi:Tfp pilus assembly protein PilV